MKRLASISLTALAFTLTAQTASATGFLVAHFGADHGNAAQGNPFAVYYNPGALGAASGTQISIDGAPILRFATYERGADALSDAKLADPNNNTPEAVRYRNANTGKATLSNVQALGFVGLSTDLGLKNSGFRLGYATYIPFGGMASWDKRADADPTAPGAKDGVQRWHNISGQLLSVYNTLAAAYMIESARLSFGASVTLSYNKVDTVRARTGLGDDVIERGPSLTELRARLTASNVNVAIGGGVYWEPIRDRLSLGLSYISQPGLGTMRMGGELLTEDGSSTTRATAQKVDFLQAMPDVIRLAVDFKATSSLILRLDMDYARWSVFKNQCIVTPGAECTVDATGAGNVTANFVRNWRDAVGVRAGAGYLINDMIEIFGSAAIGTSAAPKETIDVSTIDAFKIYGTAGAHFAINEHIGLGSSLNLIYFVPVDTKGSNTIDTLATPTRTPSSDGKYTSLITWLNVNATYKF